MKTFRFLFIALAVMLSIKASAHDFKIDGIYYNITSSSDLTVGVTYRGSSYDSYSDEYSGSVVIPEKVTYDSKEYSVTSIGTYAFEWCSGLTSVTIPNSVTSIGAYAFEYCSGLTSVTIPNSVTSIGTYAFEGCHGIKSIHITDLSAWCKIKFGGNMSNPTEYTHHLYLNGEEITNLVIPDDVTSIGNYAFYNCSGITSVTIPNSVTSIGGFAFYDCSGLTSVTIGNSVTSIGNRAFNGCSGLTSVTIPNSVSSIGESAFNGCSGLTSVTIPNSVTSIEWGAFRNCSGLTSVDIPNSVSSIGGSTFRECSGLTSITIPNSVTSIGEYAFQNCSGLTAVHITDLSAWYKITFEDEYANPMYSSSNEVTYVNDMELTDLTIPDSIMSIPEYAFRGCSSLRRLTIPESCKTVPQYAFRDCNNLQELTLSSTCIACYDYSFYGCSSLKKINCQAETPPAAYPNTFSSSIYNSATLNVPEGSADKYKAASFWKKFTNMTVGGSELKQCAAPVITYADGKLQFACETEGAQYRYTLTDTDIKSVYTDVTNSTVNLSACYTIKAYAYADGYTNSEQVTATLYWIDGSDVSTNINQTEMRGVMATCSGGIITVSGLTDGETVMFYNANGALLYTGTAQNGTISYAPSASGVIIVKIGTTSIKVVNE